MINKSIVIFFTFFFEAGPALGVLALDSLGCGGLPEYTDCIHCCVDLSLIKDEYFSNPKTKVKVYCGKRPKNLNPNDIYIQEVEMKKIAGSKWNEICKKGEIVFMEKFPRTLDGCRLECKRIRDDNK